VPDLKGQPVHYCPASLSVHVPKARANSVRRLCTEVLAKIDLR
jgi:hypothetical protein